MFIIFGTNNSDELLGYRNTTCKCCNCNNEVKNKIFSKNDNFTLFFIPVIHYNKRYYEACPICNHGIEITEYEAKSRVNN